MGQAVGAGARCRWRGRRVGRPTVVLPCVLFACAGLLSPTPVTAETPATVLVQESNGFPGGERSGGLVQQSVAIQGGRMRVLDLENAWALFVDLDDRMVREADVSAREYVERSFDYYLRYRDERKRNLAAQAREFIKGRERLEDGSQAQRQWDDEYRRGGGDPKAPGKITARLQPYYQDVQKAEILVDREPKRVTLHHFVIRENQADRPVFDLWVTNELPLEVDLFRFYRELGTFSSEVTRKLAELRKLYPTIVRCTAVLDTGSLTRTFEMRLREIRHESLRVPLVVPKGWKLVVPEAQPAPEARRCYVTGDVIPPGQGVEWRPPGSGRTIVVKDKSLLPQAAKKWQSEKKARQRKRARTRKPRIGNQQSGKPR